ncbi:phage tail protein [Paracoccus sp. 22332]|uniref:phage tail protein n=1 Tax=Paracoccus sp. 22332 TaxID=3453913 RepID=UPI003F875D3D
MANLPESNEYPAGIYQIETTDPVLGGPPSEATKAGLTNIPAMQLAKRTNWLKFRVDQLLAKAIAATTAVAGLVRLSNAVNSTSETEAATSRAVKTVNDNANTRVPSTRSIAATGLATGGGDLGADIGIDVRIATQLEAETGVLNNRAMTPLRVAQYVSALFRRSIGGSGYIILPGGLIVQWLSVAVTGTNLSVTASLPTTFPNAAAGALSTRRSATPITANDASATDLALGQVTVRRAVSPDTSATYFVVAIGW